MPTEVETVMTNKGHTVKPTYFSFYRRLTSRHVHFCIYGMKVWMQENIRHLFPEYVS